MVMLLFLSSHGIYRLMIFSGADLPMKVSRINMENLIYIPI
jgi:hypothetical protein